MGSTPARSTDGGHGARRTTVRVDARAIATWAAVALIPALLAACQTPRPPGTAPDAAPDVSDAIEASSDAVADAAAPVTSETCWPCLYDTECGDGGACVALDPTNAPATRSCLVPCDTPGAACTGSGIAAMCEPGPNVVPVCTPAATCVGSALGAACSSAAPCRGRYSVCAAAPGATAAACLAPCTRDSDCESGFTRCAPVAPVGSAAAARACVPDAIVGPQRCGAAPVEPSGVGAPCAAGDAGCPAPLACVAGEDPAVAGFCTRSCRVDADCAGAGTRCLAVGARGLVCVPADCACVAGPRDTRLDCALAAGHQTRCDLYFAHDDIDVFGADVTQDRFRLPVFDRVHRDFLAGAAWARSTGPALGRHVASLSVALAAADAMLRTGDPDDLVAPVALAPPAGASPLADAVAALITAYGGTPDAAALRADATDVPPALQTSLAAIVTAVLRAAQARDRGLLFATGPDDVSYLYDAAPHPVLPQTSAHATLDPTRPLDLGAMLGDVVLPVAEATSLAATIEAQDLAGAGRFAGMLGPSFTAQTPLGAIVVRDAAAHTYATADFPAVALLVDLGGNDTYTAPVGANASGTNSVSVLIDLAGDDTYAYEPQPTTRDAGALPSDAAGRYGSRAQPFSLSDVVRQGAGRLGVGLLYDLGAGVDHYSSLRGSQGFGALGIGGLYDDGGDDVYALEAGGQGAGVFGIGVLLDRAGDDAYTTWNSAQGYGYVRGAGLLIDLAGADQYTAMTTPVLYPSGQDATVNSSVAQGVGFGRRADTLPDRVDMSGGIGVLFDPSGDDRYVCSIFCQGAGYWGGMGLLLDAAGDDAYDGRWYVQGSAAHFAYGAMVDGGGRDVHNATATRQDMTAGAGHDFSLGILLADGDDGDTYNAPNLALGAGNANGAGIFADQGGDDSYAADDALTCGNATLETLDDPARLARPTLGIFLEGGGTDRYARAGVATDPVQNDASWLQRIHPTATSEVGVGCDGSDGGLGL